MKPACLALLAALCGCWGSSAYYPVPSTVETKTASSFSNQIPTGTSTIFVFGYYFSAGTTVQWDGRPQKTTYLGRPAQDIGPLTAPQVFEVQVDLDDQATRQAGTAKVTASDGSGPISEILTVQVIDAAFTFAGASPAQLEANATANTLALTGTGFRADTVVVLDGTQLVLTFVSSTSVTAQVPAALLAHPGDRILQLQQRPCTLALTDPAECQSELNQSGISAIVPVGPAGVRSLVRGSASDLVWDATHARLFASITPPASPNVLASIDLTTGAIGVDASIPFAATTSTRIAVSAQDQFIYFLGNFGVQRLSLPGLTGLTSVNSGFTSAMQPASASPQTVAVVGSSSAIFDGGTQRPKTDNNNTIAFEALSLAWNADDSRLYVLGSSTPTFVAFQVDATGITGTTILPARFSGREVVFDRATGRLFGSGGESYDAQGGDPRPLFPASQFGDFKMAVDGALGKAFFASNELHYLTVRAYDIATQTFLGRIVLQTGTASGGINSPSKLVRWGQDGLALATTGGVYLYSGPFVR